MEAHNDRIAELIGKFEQGEATPEEIRELEAWYASFDNAEKYIYQLTDQERERLKDYVFNNVMQQMEHEPIGKRHMVIKRMHLRRVVVGLLVMVLLAAGYYTWQAKVSSLETNLLVDALPGGNKATLTLADGSVVDLNRARAGQVATERGMKIMKFADGELRYEAIEQRDMTASNESVFNTLVVPSGGQYNIVLPDGTVVWMNAESSLRYPTSFSTTTREVELIGEAYFSVKQAVTTSQSQIPFIVKTPDYRIEVLGTEFNVNAYRDEQSVSTTLVSGHVNIVLLKHDGTDTPPITLLPSQQATLEGGKIKIVEVDVLTATAWKDGFFYFSNTDLYTLIRQFSRWYDVDVIYEEGVENDVFFGKISRKYTLSEALKVLELGDVNFQIEAGSKKAGNNRKRLILNP